MFTKCPQLLKCIAGVNIMNKNGVSLKKIKIQNEKSWLPPKYLNECETFEVHYHFFQKQPRIKKANITYPSKEQCAQRKPEIQEPRRPGFQIEGCKLGIKPDASGLVDPRDLLSGKLRINWKEVVTNAMCVKKIEYLVMNGAAIRNESFLPGIMGVGIIPPLSDLDLCLPTFLSLKISL